MPTKTPYRIPLGGGGTDLPEFYEKYGGFCWGATIDRYVWIDKKEEGVFEYSVKSDLPIGSGMGGSGAYKVGRLLADNPTAIPKWLAEHADEKGKQDQYLAAYGGFIALEINKQGKVKVERLKFKQDLIDELNSKLMLQWTGLTHDTKIQQEKGLDLNGMLKIKEIGQTMLSEMKSGNIKNFGTLMNEHWTIKRMMNGMTNKELDEIYEEGLKTGAEGGKLLGSGGGGFFLFYGDVESNFKFTFKGSEYVG